MKNQIKLIATPLSEDLGWLIKEKLSKDGYKLENLCKENQDNGIMLLKDGNPALPQLSQDDFLSVFDLGKNHLYLKPEQVMRIGIACRLPFYSIVSLMLKALWELHLYENLKSQNFTLNHLFQNQKLLIKIQNSFKLTVIQVGDLFKLLEGYDHLVSQIGESSANFMLTIDEMLANNLHLIPNRSVEDAYGYRKLKENRLLNEHKDNSLKSSFIELKKRFVKLLTLITNLLYDILEVKLLNQNIDDQYLRIFGDQYYKYKEVFIDAEIYEARIRIKENNPSLTEEEVNAELVQLLTEKEAELEELQKNMKRTCNYYPSFFDSDHKTFSNSEILKYVQEIRKLLDKCYKILHPDLLSAELSKKLTEEQHEELNELWYQVMDVRNNFVYKPDQIGFSYPDLFRLETIYFKAETIYKTAGIDVSSESVILGDTLEEQVTFLQRINTINEKSLLEFENEKQLTENNSRVNIYRKILSSTELTEEHHNELREKADFYIKKRDELKSKFKSLFDADKTC